MAGSDVRRLAMHPQGAAGRLFSRVMERMNEGAYRHVLHLLAETPCHSVLEIGFGTGRLLELLARAGSTVLAGVDPTPDMVERARSRLARLGREVAIEADLRCTTADDLPWPDAHFDAVLALHSFQFWPCPEQVVADIRRLLARHGRLVLVLRDHGSVAPSWLPNALSRSGDEVGATLRLLQDCGFDGVREAEPAGDSRVLVATRN